MRKTQILLVDDHSVVRMGLAAIINLEPDLHVCGEAKNGEEAVKLASKLTPDVIIMDLMMPKLNGAEATSAIKNACPDSKILILTTFATSIEISNALNAGATSAATKDLTNQELVEVIRKTADGIKYISPEIKESVLDEDCFKSLSKRQLDIIDSITRGLNNQDIATMLGISRSRVKQHLAEVFEKLGAANRAEAVAIAMRRQLLKNISAR